MRSPRWHKVLADMKVSHSRTILVILSIAIGVFAVGTMLTSRVVLHQGIDGSFDLANPASAVLMTEPFDAEVVTAAAGPARHCRCAGPRHHCGAPPDERWLVA